MATVEELVDKYIVAVNNKYETPGITEPERHALASEYLQIQTEIKRKTGLPIIGMSVANHDELQNLKTRAEVILSFIGQSLAGDSKVAPAVTRRYIEQVAVNDKAASRVAVR